MAVKFLDLINEDIKEIQKRNPNVADIHKNEYAFNFWVLDKLYSVDEELIQTYVIDYKDRGIDCYVWDDDNKDLYIIQNKYFGENTKLSLEYINNNFLETINILDRGTYVRSRELQNIYTNNKQDSNFAVHLKLYITHEKYTNRAILEAIDQFNVEKRERNIDAKILDLSEMQKSYFHGDDEEFSQGKHFDFKFTTPYRGTILSVNKRNYGIETDIDAKYVLISNYEIYNLIETAKSKGYPIFDKNIREFLGTKVSVNKKIRNTLKDERERKNFFFYNNGITIIVKDFKDDNAGTRGSGRIIKIVDPQIVNGCQTVSTIHDVVSEYSDDEKKDFFSIKKSSVMVKFFITDNGELCKNIVRYNNSQNSIKDKDFTSNQGLFKRIQTEFINKGLLLLIRQSDKNKFQTEYRSPANLLNISGDDLKKFGLYKDRPETKDLFIDLEKYLQSIAAFQDKPVNAVQNKSKLLVPESSQYSLVTNFIKESTNNDLYYLALLFMKADKNKFVVKDKKGANPFYVLYFFKNFECHDKKISDYFSDYDSKKIDDLFKRYNWCFRKYYDKWTRKYGKTYQDMIKNPIDEDVLYEAKRETEEDFSEM